MDTNAICTQCGNDLKAAKFTLMVVAWRSGQRMKIDAVLCSHLCVIAWGLIEATKEKEIG